MKQIEEVLREINKEIKISDEFREYYDSYIADEAVRGTAMRCRVISIIRYLKEVHGITICYAGYDKHDGAYIHTLYRGRCVKTFLPRFKDWHYSEDFIQTVIHMFLESRYDVCVAYTNIVVDKNIVCHYMLEDFRDNVLEDPEFVIAFEDYDDANARITNALLGKILPRHNIRLR